ncbi:histidine kinase [Bacillus sp. FJAT-18019]|uniref:Histidine kinase n=1 Tax=Paenibacillus solani TaxID=1705565 RepID=A0A0M1NJH9_9BACL|nr:HD-GYP domain-containing protein [Paenibacillus solani]KOP66989.1 histidine kinase [Bacillus sp. FJAT-18019]KOR82200.1 histidine kinase [Paenibacillus solani]
MRLIPINALRPGMVLGKKIYSSEGLILLAEGVELTAGLIRRLGTLEIGYVYIEDRMTDDIIVPELLTEETQQQALRSLRTSFKNLENQPALKGSFHHLGKTFSGMMESIMDEISEHDECMVLLTEMNTNDYNLYRHSLNVCIYTTVLGVAHGYSRDELKVLGLGALLHDIGKTRISQKLLQHPGRLNDEEFREVQKHTEIGFAILKDEPNIPLLSAHCALSHHERLDGSGYPRALKGPDIHEYAKWIAITDSYDAMTTQRVYKPALLPHEAVEVMYAGSGKLFEQSFLATFRDRVAIYPPGITVKLHTGESGVVSKIHANVPHRPVVRVLTDAEGVPLPAPHELDLSQTLTTMITGIGHTNQEHT